MVNVDSGPEKPDTIIRPITPRNVISLPSSLRKTFGKELPKQTTQLNAESAEKEDLNNLFTVQNNSISLPNGKSFIDHIFEKYDDMQAAYTKKDRTPEIIASQYAYSAMENHTPSPRNYEKFETEETRRRRMLATIEGRKDFSEILEHAGINSDAYLADVFRNKTNGNKQKFGCSTPIASQTPKSSRINTPLPLSGIRLLISPLTASNVSNGYVDSFTTPQQKWDFFTDNERTPQTENMETILLGITCYVDVRTDRQNCSETCKRELVAIGAKVEKNFTKKVTHVVFKEGRMSTYLKAKKSGVPIVSVLWIEACKIARGPVDPKLYPPTRMEKYECEPSFSEIMSKKLRRLRKGRLFLKELKAQSLNLSSNVCNNSNKRKAVTEVKGNRTQEQNINNNKERHCTKKLNFIDIEEPKKLGDENKDLMKLDGTLNESSTNLSDSSTFAKFKLNTLPKRKSAPGALAKKKTGRLKTLNAYFVKENNYEKRERSKSPDENVNPENIEQKNNKRKDFGQKTESKRRKLFDPNEIHILKENPINSNAEISFPYRDSPVRNKKTKNRVNKTSLSEEDPEMKAFEMDESCISAGRNSLSFFTQKNEKVTSCKLKQIPTIVFTSIHRKECTDLTNIIKKLGTFEVEDKVSERTSHVVTNCLRRTLNLLRGLARGCWLVQADWIIKSGSVSQWLAEEHFELRSLSPAVTECRLQRQAFKKSFQMDLFSSCGLIYVAPNTNPPTQDLIDLIKLCRGKVISCARGAKIIIGDKATSDRSIVRIREKWILDSIFYYKLMEMNDYIIQSKYREIAKKM